MNTFANQLNTLISPLLADAGMATRAPHWMAQSFLAMVLLLGSAFILQGTWNGLMAEFPQIGRLSYFRAVHLVSIGGVLLIAMFYLLC